MILYKKILCILICFSSTVSFSAHINIENESDQPQENVIHNQESVKKLTPEEEKNYLFLLEKAANIREKAAIMHCFGKINQKRYNTFNRLNPQQSQITQSFFTGFGTGYGQGLGKGHGEVSAQFIAHHLNKVIDPLTDKIADGLWGVTFDRKVSTINYSAHGYENRRATLQNDILFLNSKIESLLTLVESEQNDAKKDELLKQAESLLSKRNDVENSLIKAIDENIEHTNFFYTELKKVNQPGIFSS